MALKSSSRKLSRRKFIEHSSLAVGGAALSGSLGMRWDKNGIARGAEKVSHQSRGCPWEVREALSGPWPSINTPFARDGTIDTAGLRKHLDFLIEEAKAKAIVLTWGDSLYSLLTDDEIAEVTKVVARHVADRAFVVAADNRWWTGKEVEFARYCAGLDVDMLMVLPPDWAHSTTLDTLVAHYQAVSRQIPVMIVTNYLASRGNAFGIELIGRLLREVPGVMALKDDVGSAFIRKVCLLTHDWWALSAGGQKQNHMNMVSYGVSGYLSTFLSFKPEIAWRYWRAIEDGDLDAAVEVIRNYDMPLFDHMIAKEGSFNAAIHGLYELYGIAGRYRRPPYHTLTDAQMERLAAFLKSKGLL